MKVSICYVPSRPSTFKSIKEFLVNCCKTLNVLFEVVALEGFKETFFNTVCRILGAFSHCGKSKGWLYPLLSSCRNNS